MASSNGTVGECIAQGYGIRATCLACWHNRTLDMAILATRLGVDHGALHRDLVPKLRCSACGSKRIALTVLAPNVPTIERR
ncbi:hypothetical protein GCM10017643_18470 [Ancylobacter dichloromethanicus]|uniref:Uncharacterized protein n=1 Tax=Ancylobacter dichloromethanicus TaxID=518825 RepID=A0A9W6J6M2_9HYPH|nr:hypothetical protein GCM10017643_18470 [Ancylobacter dichloromethanicus]